MRPWQPLGLSRAEEQRSHQVCTTCCARQEPLLAMKRASLCW